MRHEKPGPQARRHLARKAAREAAAEAPVAYEVTFRIDRPTPGLTDEIPTAAARDEFVRRCADVVRRAAGLPKSDASWAKALEPNLVAGHAVRVRLSERQFLSFFLLRRAVGGAVAHRLKWEDPRESAGDWATGRSIEEVAREQRRPVSTVALEVPVGG
jgi:hypothetical protein